VLASIPVPVPGRAELFNDYGSRALCSDTTFFRVGFWHGGAQLSISNGLYLRVLSELTGQDRPWRDSAHL
jgi:hypothetical protein